MQPSSSKPKLYYSNCLIRAVVIFCLFFPSGRISFDFNSPTGRISFYCDIRKKYRYRFRRKIRRHSNKGMLLFYGYTVIELIGCEIPKNGKYGLE